MKSCNRNSKMVDIAEKEGTYNVGERENIVGDKRRIAYRTVGPGKVFVEGSSHKGTFQSLSQEGAIRLPEGQTQAAL